MNYADLGIKIPQPGELWRVIIKPVEWFCPNCKEPLHLMHEGLDGQIVRIYDYHLEMEHCVCGHKMPMPEGWVACMTTGTVLGGYALPYTMLEEVLNG